MKKFAKRAAAFITAIAAMTVGMTCVSADENVETSGDTKYISYNCVTGEETVIDMSKYVCNVTSVESDMAPGDVEPNVVIGPDTRAKVEDTTIAPYKGIAYVSCVKQSSNYRGTCSAFASNAVITAAHVVWDSTSNTCAENIQLTFGKNGNTAPYGTITTQPTEIIIPEEYKETQSTSYDYAILLYNSTISSYRFGFTSSTSVGTDVTVTGYPKDTSTAPEDGSSNSYYQWYSSGDLKSVGTYTVTYEIDTTGGQSGAPVYNSSNQIVAIHHGGNSTRNTARKVDSTLFNLMYQIRNGTYVG